MEQQSMEGRCNQVAQGVLNDCTKVVLWKLTWDFYLAGGRYLHQWWSMRTEASILIPKMTVLEDSRIWIDE